jgi:hypothetical protein
MSDPAKSANEIEDVLASIRRLVTENNAAPTLAVRSAHEPARLVLTPAQRITDPDDPWAPVPTTDAEAVKAEARDTDLIDEAAEDPTWGLEDRLSDWGEIEGSAEEAVEDAIAEQADETPPAPPHDARIGVFADAQEDEAQAVEFESETGDADWPDQGPSNALRELALARGQAPAAETEAAADQPDADADVGISGMHDAGGTDHESERTQGEPPMGHDTTVETEGAQGEDMAGGITRTFSRRLEVHRPMAQGVQAVSSQAEVSEEANPAAADPDEVEDDIEDLGDDPQPFAFPETEDGMLDEETLREIIAEVVREELQGALGQRITRNVRKMVRREIRLALAAQDLE